MRGFGEMLIMLILLPIITYAGVHLIIAGEGAIANAINSAGISGIAGVLIMMALPGSLAVYFLTKQ